MEYEIIKWGAYVIVGVLGALLAILWAEHKDLRKTVHENYVRKDDYRNTITELKSSIKETQQPLFNKLDKLEDLLIRHLTVNEKKP